MNNIMVSLKKFITNKNVVTIVGVIAILALLYIGYTKTIEKETNPRRVPVAATTIQPRTLITEDMIKYIEVPGASISGNVIFNSSLIIGKYTDVNTVIPEGSMIYSDVIVSKDELPDKAFIEVKDGERPYALSVNTENTYGNSIFPGSVVDVYMKATDENGQIMIGRLLDRYKVLAVKDHAGEHVFENTSAPRTPATLLFGVSEEVFILLKKAEYLGSFGVELFPVPYGGTVEIEEASLVDRQELVDFIESNTVTFSQSGNQTGTGTESNE